LGVCAPALVNRAGENQIHLTVARVFGRV